MFSYSFCFPFISKGMCPSSKSLSRCLSSDATLSIPVLGSNTMWCLPSLALNSLNCFDFFIMSTSLRLPLFISLYSSASFLSLPVNEDIVVLESSLQYSSRDIPSFCLARFLAVPLPLLTLVCSSYNLASNFSDIKASISLFVSLLYTG